MLNADFPLLPGLVSITFRQLTPEQIIALLRQSGLPSVEWGGDVHVPPGDVARAADIRRQCADAGILISAYGSYYRAGENPDSFAPILDTAAALGTDTIRVWAGTKSSAAATPLDRHRVADDLRRCCLLAAARNVSISTEFHGGTLTDDAASCIALLDAVAAPNLSTFWQPPNGMDLQHALGTLGNVIGRLSNVHVFHWWPTPDNRRPLRKGIDRWRQYLSRVKAQCVLDGRRRFASMEFVVGDDPDRLRDEAVALREILDAIT